jgi:MFS family permease
MIMTTHTEKKSSLSTSVKLTRAGLRVVLDDKKLIGIAALSGTISLLIFTAVIALAIMFWPYIGGDKTTTASYWLYYGGLAVVGLIVSSVATFFNAAITHAALRRFEGERISFGQALGAAATKKWPLLGYVALNSTVGLVLGLIADRLPFFGRLVIWLVGASWSVATMFAVPVIMTGTESRPLRVVKKSATTFVGIWKESVFVGLSLGVISIIGTIVIMVVVLGLFALSIVTNLAPLAVVALAVLVLTAVALGLASTALSAVLMSAAYYYASTGRVPAGFDDELVRSMFRPKKKWLNV